MAKSHGPQCLIEGCEELAASRGLCPTCYANARKAIRDGLVSEKQLVAKKLMVPSRRGRRPVDPKFRQALEKVLGR